MRISRTRKIFKSLFAVCLVIYFSFHFLQGDQGLYALMQEKYKIKNLKNKLNDATQKNNKLKAKVNMMRGDHIDIDLLEEQARKILSVAGTDEAVIIN